MPHFERITAILTSYYEPTFITIATRGSSAEYGVVEGLFVRQFVSFLDFLLRPFSGSRRSIFHPFTSNDIDCYNAVPFEDLAEYNCHLITFLLFQGQLNELMCRHICSGLAYWAFRALRLFKVSH
jgi:hypothetical protein